MSNLSNDPLESVTVAAARRKIRELEDTRGAAQVANGDLRRKLAERGQAYADAKAEIVGLTDRALRAEAKVSAIALHNGNLIEKDERRDRLVRFLVGCIVDCEEWFKRNNVPAMAGEAESATLAAFHAQQADWTITTPWIDSETGRAVEDEGGQVMLPDGKPVPTCRELLARHQVSPYELADRLDALRTRVEALAELSETIDEVSGFTPDDWERVLAANAKARALLGEEGEG